MCGIAGFVDRSEPDASASIRRMLDLIRHRGPDGEGTHIETTKGLAFGMRRLSIIDIEGGRQPIWNEDETVGIVFNGEIYNHRELRFALPRHHFRSETDTEVLVHGYEEWGLEGLLQRIAGMFAFALLDAREPDNVILMLVRDRLGIKPLYYSAAATRLGFASEGSRQVARVTWRRQHA